MSVTAPQGFRASGVVAGLKASGRPDLALVVNDGPLQSAAAVYTSNRFVAAPVVWSRQVTSGGAVRAVVLNSGGANCGTGPQGFQTTHATAEAVAAGLADGAGRVVVCSTGLIGVHLDRDAVLAGVEVALQDLDAAGGDRAATAIMTTDSVSKQAVVRDPAGFVVGGMAKGAGMLAPALATMLVVLTTDADVSSAACDAALREACRLTFDRLDSDGCQSTNDTVVLLASGASGVSPDPAAFAAAVHEVCRALADQLLRDAEGSAHDITIAVRGAASEDDALEVARSVARNNLVKCAFFGEDPNWGRILAAVGTTQAAFEVEQVDVLVNGVQVCRGGQAHADPALVRFGGRDVLVEVDLHAGPAAAQVRTNDLTTAYVHENSAYST